jgi:hypothetical protein
MRPPTHSKACNRSEMFRRQSVCDYGAVMDQTLRFRSRKPVLFLLILCFLTLERMLTVDPYPPAVRDGRSFTAFIKANECYQV